MSSNKNAQFIQILDQLKSGSTFVIWQNNGDRQSRFFYLDEYEDFIAYNESKTSRSPKDRYYIRKIDEVRVGFNSMTFEALLQKGVVKMENEPCALSIFYNRYRDEIHLMTSDEITKDNWIKGLRGLIRRNARKGQGHVLRDTNWILSHLRSADKDNSNTIDRNECRQLLSKSLNVELPAKTFDALFQEANKTGVGTLNPDEFIEFFNLVTRRIDLFEIMQNYVRDGSEKTIEKIHMRTEELLYFLEIVQNQRIMYSTDEASDQFRVEPIATSGQVQELIDQFEPSARLKQKGQLSLIGFRNLLLSEEFSLMQPWCSQTVYQDMTRPLNHYFINSSHNTYLFDSQLTGNSNPEAYNRALRWGCRVVEMDCYDGDNGSPIVTHGNTLVKPCSFESIIRFIEPNLFKASPYPVIFSIENHCSNVQSQKMGEILKRILGDRLVIPPAEGQSSPIFPSPENLKYKVVVRSTKTSSPAQTISQLVGIRKHIKENSNGDEEISADAGNKSDDFVFFESAAFRASDINRPFGYSFRSPSLSEGELKQAIQSDPNNIMLQNKLSLLRMYPGGIRQDSSNPNPIDGWNVGIPIVALNYQTDDRMMELCHGKFLDNGGCGYVLKPDYLIDVEVSKFNPMKYAKEPPKSHKRANDCPQRLTITVISGQFINRSSEKTSDVPDPYVLISTHGVGCDQKEVKTKFVNNNGLNPTWNETFSFDIYFPEMCLVRFEVFDYDTLTHDDRVAYFCLPMTTMQTGYRHIHLKARDHGSTYSTLFILVKKEKI